jgi:Outer membrane protein beta-barrel domain
MRNTKILLFVIASIVAPLATRAEAQVHFSVGGGFTAPNSEVRDHLGNGYNFNLGLQVDVTPVIGIEGLYSFNGLGKKDLSINVFPQPLASGGVPTDISADMNMQYGTANLVVQRPNGGVRPYGLVGMGVYYRPIKVSTLGARVL